MNHKRKITIQQLSMELIVGILFAGALVILGIFTIFISANQLKSLKYEYTVTFNKAGGLRVGDKVLLRGVEIGQITSLEFSETNPNEIVIRFRTHRPLQFREGYLIEVHSSSILGGSFLYIELGDPSASLVTGTLRGENPVDVLAEAGKLVHKLQGTIDGLQTFIKGLSNTQSTLYKIMNEDTLYQDISQAFKTLGEGAKKIESAIEGFQDIGQSAKGTLERFSKAAESIDQAAIGVRDAANSVGKAADSVKQTSDNLNLVILDAREGKGTVGKLLTDDKLYHDFQGAAEQIRIVARKAVDAQSSIGKLLADDGAMYNSVKTAFDNFGNTMGDAKVVVETIRKGEGTIGKLIMDDSIWEDLKRTIKAIQGAVEDYREQAPILTFGSFIFGSL